MDATFKSGAETDEVKRIKLAKQCSEMVSRLLTRNYAISEQSLLGLRKILKGINSGYEFTYQIQKPNSIMSFLEYGNCTEGKFNQLVSELDTVTLLDQLERVCLDSGVAYREIIPYLHSLLPDEYKTFTYPYREKTYVEPKDQIKKYRSIFGSSLSGKSTLSRLKSTTYTTNYLEGMAIFPKMSTLARVLGVKGHPLMDADGSFETYNELVSSFMQVFGNEIVKNSEIKSFSSRIARFPIVDTVTLTPSCIAAWDYLEKSTEDDFCYFEKGSSMGKHAYGASPNRARVNVLISGSQYPQDCLMVGSSLLANPELLKESTAKYIVCIGNLLGIDSNDCINNTVAFITGSNLLFTSTPLSRPHPGNVYAIGHKIVGFEE